MKRICVTHHICDCNMEQMQKLEKENAKLKLDIEGRKDSYNDLDDINIKLNEQKNKLTAALKVAEDALEFYAATKYENAKFGMPICESLVNEFYVNGALARKSQIQIKEILK